MRAWFVIVVVLLGCQTEKKKAPPPADKPAPAPAPAAPVSEAYKKDVTSICDVPVAARSDPSWKDGDRAVTNRLVTAQLAKAKAAVTDPDAKRDLAELDKVSGDAFAFIAGLDQLGARVGLAECQLSSHLKRAVERKAVPPPPK